MRVERGSRSAATGLLLLLGLGLCPAIGRAERVEDGGQVKDALAKACAAQQGLTSFRMQLRETKDLTMFTKPLVSDATLEIEKPDRFRLEHAGDDPSLVVTDGETLWNYSPKVKKADKLKMQPGWRDRFAIFNALDGKAESVEERYEVSLHLADGARVLKLIPRDEKERRETTEILVWLGDDSLPVKVRLHEPSGDKTTYEILKIEKGVAFPPERFRFDPPKGVEVKDQDAGGAP